MKITYRDDEGGSIKLTVSYHAMERFRQRWMLLYNISPPTQIARYIEDMINRSYLIDVTTDWERQKRAMRYPGSMFFRYDDFIFIITDQTVITIEIAREDSLYLNKVA